VRGDTHAGCGERSGETGPWQHRHRAPDRLNARGWTVSVRMPSELVIFLRVLATPLRSSLVPAEETKNALARGLGQRRSRSAA